MDANHPELDSPVTAHMRVRFASLTAGENVGQALNRLRAEPPSERILYLYVLDDQRRIVGVIPVRRLLTSSLETPLTAIMVQPVIAIPDTATLLEACEFFLLHRLLAFPIINDQKQMVGLVDVELFAAELNDLEERSRTDDLFQLIGVQVSAARGNSAWAGYLARFPWLICNIVGGLLAAVVSWLFAADLERTVALALFVPVVLALAESVSVQSVSLALQLVPAAGWDWQKFWDALRKEFLTGGLLGISSGACVGLAALAWLGHGPLAILLLMTIAGSMTFAAWWGYTLPTLIRMLDRDPNIASGPIVLASADLFTLVLYFSLARWWL
ncbi:MAG: magnesium transporter [Pirellulales bacterium]|nr:magnesium transporter [Pirellulales bacterium]